MTRLNEFIAKARRRVADGAYEPQGDRLAKHGSLVAAIRADARAIIAELKPASPSAGRLLRVPTLDVLDAYRRGGATAISVLAASDDFEGSPRLVRQANAIGLPVLWKDFVVDADQITCAAHAGASAVLLIERCFDDPRDRERLVKVAHESGLEVLLEVFDEADAERAVRSDADLLGVNARDLETLRIDNDGALHLVKRLSARPDGRPVLALSGVRNRADRRRARSMGAAAVLVGTALLRCPDPALALTAMRRPLAKVCGLTDTVDIDAALAAGADLCGVITASPGSPRDTPLEEAARLIRHIRDQRGRAVLVTREQDGQRLAALAQKVAPDWLQVHAAGPVAAPSLPVPVLWAVARADDVPDGAVGFVFDGAHPDGTTGGSGQLADPTAGARAVRAHAVAVSLIAGGLDADRAPQALADSGAWGADASSRLESAPGKKDANAVAAFVAAVHEADA